MEDSEVKMEESKVKTEESEVKMVDLEVKMVENQETEPDVRWFGGEPSNSSGRAAVAAGVSDVIFGSDEPDRNIPPPIKFNKYDMYYDMTGEKHLIIFNHAKYEKTMYFGYERPPERNGTDKDVTSLQGTFLGLGFKTDVYHNLRYKDILETMKKVCKQDHRGTSCIAVAVMTHGDDGGEVYAADMPYALHDLICILQNSDAGLVGKPKLLFVQACRGKNMDDGRRVQTDGRESIVLPTHADTLIVYSSAEHHLAYRDANGSWLMQSLCDVIAEHHQNFDLLHMITFVHQAVAYKSTYTRSEHTTNKKMMPETKFTLTKLLKL